MEYRKMAEVGLTAAAEVGDEPPRTDQYAIGPYEIMRDKLAHEALDVLEKLEAVTIERCAQIADKYIGTYGGAISIAAAIRAMKDQP